MCGIALAKTEEDVESILTLTQHRGRDGQCVMSLGHWWIGQNRLAIVCRGEAGAQPYRSSTGVTAFNGELYNYKEVASLLSMPGQVCRSEVEVLDRVMHQHLRFDRVLDGYWGIVRVTQDGRVILSRDLFGVIPIYYQMQERRLVRVASERKALVGRCYEVRAGETLAFDHDGRLTKRVQFDPYSLHLEPLDTDHLVYLFQRAVRRRYDHAEVPVTIALSGGLDSSLVARACQWSMGPQLTAVTVVMNTASDEAQNARRFCEEFGIVHYVVEISKKEIEEARDAMKYTLEDVHDNPVKWRGFVRNYFVAKHAPGVVILCGEGADEVAAGYDSHQRVRGLALEWKSLSTLRSMPAINLDRVNKGGMAWTKEFRVPFLDRALVLYLMGCQKIHNKGALRLLAEELQIPPYILNKPKYGSEESALENTR